MPGKDRTRIKDKPVRTTVTARETRSRTKGARDAIVAALRKEAEEHKESLKKRREEAATSRKPGRTGERNDGSLHIAFIEMGQGDCIVMCTPKGRVILFDCGALGKEKEDKALGDKQADALLVDRVQKTLKDPKFLGRVNEIDILVLTHPDSDHCNKLEKVIPFGCKIYKCYHSAEFGQYSAGEASAFVRKKMHHSAILQVVKSYEGDSTVDDISLNGIPVEAATEDDKIDRLYGKDGERGILIVDEENCKVSILAAGVEKDYAKDHSNDTNRGSIVTLVEAFGEKILLCGDATRSTEAFLLKTAKNKVKNLTVVQTGHHGSITTSSSLDFINWVNPKVVVASAGREIDKHHHPSHEVIQNYVDRLELSDRTELSDEHETFVWEPNKGGNFSHSSIWTKHEVFSTGSQRTAVTLDYPEI